jgi:hypothetical protein
MTNLIRAVVVDPGVPDRLVIREVEPPSPLPHQAIASAGKLDGKIVIDATNPYMRDNNKIYRVYKSEAIKNAHFSLI